METKTLHSSFFNEHNLPLIMKIHIDDKYTLKLKKYLQNKTKDYKYDSLIEYDKSIRFPVTVTPSLSSSSFIESMFSSSMDKLFFLNENINDNNSNHSLCLMESVIQPCNVYMTLVEESYYQFSMNGLSNSFECNKMFAYDKSIKIHDTIYEDNGYFYPGNMSLENKTSYNLPPLCQSTFESNKTFPTKIHIKDTSVQCDILKNSSTNDSQIQTNQSVLNASFNCLKSINLFNESNIHDVGTTTNGIIFETGLKAKHKSIRVMVRPQSRNVKLQTPLNMIPSNIKNSSNNRPMNKNLCISVDKIFHQQHQQTTTMTMTDDTTIADNNTLVDYNPRIPQFLPVDISECAQSIESDSWIWPATPPSIKSDKNSNNLITSTCDSHIGQAMDYQQHHTSHSSEKISNQTFTYLPGPTSTEFTSSKSTFDKEVQIGLTIARYMEENLNNVDEPDGRFPEDEILHDLRRRRTNCILKMR
ncbi:unnamed protein product [Schistosoma mattheei]|uniref:Uncharacterized protein n=1 Tax=Schistosoma mattheei TaxID=31246 RepID=A0A183NEC5_9TREM|nr:unnamed protein product [Schistosoma mattheei]